MSEVQILSPRPFLRYKYDAAMTFCAGGKTLSSDIIPVGVSSKPDRDMRAWIISNAFVSVHVDELSVGFLNALVSLFRTTRRFVILNHLFVIADRNMILYAPQFTLKRLAIWHSATIGFGSCLLTEG